MARPLRLVIFVAGILGLTPLMAFAADASSDSPRFTLAPGEKYFRIDGQPSFVFGRNPVGRNVEAYDDHFRHAAEAGERLMRIHFTASSPHKNLKTWDAVLDAAEKQGLAVLPVLGVWADWNDGGKKEVWHRWDKNPFNIACGGLAQYPAELLSDTPCRQLWLARLKTLVSHWAQRRAIVAWEIFSEVDLISGATEESSIEFFQQAVATIRAIDPWRRPITISLSGVNEWPRLLKNSALDFVTIHPYSGGKWGGELDTLILSTVHDRLLKYGKPVLLGECGLDFLPPHSSLDVAPHADIGIRNALWATLVSGAMNGRMLWWQDGYDQFEKADLCRHYQQIAILLSNFVRGIDFTAFKPIACELSRGLQGGIVGNETTRLAWFRDAHCLPPDWPVRPVIGQQISMSVSGNRWQVEFFDPFTGTPGSKREITPQDGQLRILLDEFRGAIALKLVHY